MEVFLKKVKEKPLEKLDQYDFLAVGLSCHAICLLHSCGILQKLGKPEGFEKCDIEQCHNSHLVRAAIATLVGARLVKVAGETFMLTPFGSRISKHVDTFAIPFIGYRKLLANQFELVNSLGVVDNESDIDFTSVAMASIGFGEEDLDPLILKLFRSINPKGTVCDLGCGTGQKLAKICNMLGTHGLGIDQDRGAVVAGRSRFKDVNNIEFVEGDITKLNGVWEDVEVVLISFVFHDVIGDTEATYFLNSLKIHFPHIRCVVIVDIMSFSEERPTVMPGFDYVHGLQGVTPRSYDETVGIFEKANLSVLDEVHIPNMPNTYMWILKYTD